MKAKIVSAAVVVVLLAALVPSAYASIDPDPVVVLGHFFEALSAGDADAASGMFADTAVAMETFRGKTVGSSEGIAQMIASWERPGREYKIVRLTVNGDTAVVVTDVSDRGHVWGQQTTTAVVQDGMIQSLEVTDFQLQLWRVQN